MHNGSRGQATVPEKGKKGSLKKLIANLKPYRVIIIVILFLSVFGSIFSLIGPGQLEQITNIILESFQNNVGIDLATIGKIGFILLTLYLLSFVFNYLRGFLMAGITQKINDELRNRISEKINRLPLRYFDKTSYGDVLSRVTNDVDTIGQTLNQSVPMLVTSVTMLAGSVFLMFTSNVLMALTAIFVTLFGFFLVGIITKSSQKYFIAQQTEIGTINGYIEENYSGHTIVKAYNATHQVEAAFTTMNDKLYKSGWKSQFFSGIMMPLMTFVGNLSYVLVCVVGAVLVVRGSISFGVIVAFMLYARMFNNPLSQLAQIITSFQSGSAASGRVFEFLEEEELPDESEKTVKLSDVHGDVSFEHVKFGYDPDRIIINDFSVDVKAGQKIAIVGPTGAGKSTIVNLLMRFYEVNSGEIKIDGISTRDMKRESVNDLFCMVLQDTWLFEGTIAENIIYNKKDVTLEQVKSACEKVGIDYFIRTLPDGYQTMLDDKMSLSEGQKQQLTIARAMVENAPLLILDEATSSVDTRTEIVIQQAMDELMKNRTSFVIAHRLSTIKNADLILVMRDGDIVETGTHEALLEKGGFYADIYNSQFDVDEETA